MRRGKDRRLECPECGAPLGRASYLSTNTLRATHFTDGSLRTPMQPLVSKLARCPACRAFLWPDELADATETDGEAPTLENPTIEDYRDALARGIAPDQDTTKALRLELWRAENQELFAAQRPGCFGWRTLVFSAAATATMFVTDHGCFGQVFAILLLLALSDIITRLKARPRVQALLESDRREAGLRTLALHLDERVVVERLTKAEVARNLGDFDSCRDLLQFDWPVQYRPWVAEIRAGNEARDRLPRIVFLPDDDQPD